MSWLGILMFIGVGAIAGGALVAWVLTDEMKETRRESDQLFAEKQQILDAVRKGYIETLQRRAGRAS